MYKKFFASLLIAIMGVAPVAQAQSFTPPNTVQAWIAFGPGSGNEIAFRGIASQIEKTNSNIKFVVFNKPGAGEVVAFNQFVELPPKGDILYVPSHLGVFMGNEYWFPNMMKRDPFDLSLITTIGKSPMAVVTHVDSPINTPQDLIKLVRETKKPVTFGLGASAQRLVFESLMDGANGNRDLVKYTIYPGPNQAAADLVGKHVDFATMPAAVAYSFVKSGKLKYIAIAGDTKLAAIPDVPLWKDHIKNLEVYAAWGLALPPGSPPEQVKYYRDLFVTAMRTPEVKKYMDENLIFMPPGEQDPASMKAYLQGLRKQWLGYAKKIAPQN